MPKVKLTLGGQTHEVDFTPEDFAKYVQQFGMNGNGHQPHHAPAPAETKKRAKNPNAYTFDDFFQALSDRAQAALLAIKQHPDGIDSYALAKHIGFDGPEKLGGLFGPGISMIAKKHGIKVEHIYENKITFIGPDNKGRKNTFYPRKLLIEASMESLVGDV